MKYQFLFIFKFVFLDIMSWCCPVVSGTPPLARSLHTATCIDDNMLVFGGWVPLHVDSMKVTEKEWKCSDTLASFNLKTCSWDIVSADALERRAHDTPVGNQVIYR